MKRFRWIITIAAVLVVVIVAGVVYAAHYAANYASTVTKSQAHTPVPAATITGCSATASTTDLQAYQIVPAQTTASYSVYEDLIIENNPNKDAIGTTHTVQGSFSVKTGASPVVTGMNITVDLSTLKTDSSRRDDYVKQNALQTDTYPNATFVSTCTQGLPASYNDGQDVQFQLIGNMTMHGKTNQATFVVQGKVSGQTITGKATSTIYMTDYGIQPPNLANIAIAQNKVDITLDFTAQAK